jgi:hypothetical protein
MLNGAILVSQLYHNSKVNENDMIKSIDDGIDSIVYKTIEELEINKLSSNLLEVVLDDMNNNHIILDDEKYEVNGHMYRIVDILKALNVGEMKGCGLFSFHSAIKVTMLGSKGFHKTLFVFIRI